jgi:hypothetical protein
MAQALQVPNDVDEAVLGGDPFRPSLHCRALNLDRTSTVPADEVVMVPSAAPAIGRFAVRGPQHVDLAGLGQRLQRAIDGREAH